MKIAGVDLRPLALTLALGAVGGLAAHAAQLPLGYLLGSMVLVGVLAAFDIKPLGRTLTLPPHLRFSFVPVIGVAIGGAFTPEVARAALLPKQQVYLWAIFWAPWYWSVCWLRLTSSLLAAR